MSILVPALQKFYNALRQLKTFSKDNSFFDNIGCLDSFLSEYRSVTLVLQDSLGDSKHPVYRKNLEKYLLKDEKVAQWLNEQRVNVVHKHPFCLKRILRIVIYDSGNAIEFKKYEQTLEGETQIEDYYQAIRNIILSMPVPEISFSAQYLFVDEEDSTETNVFDFIEHGVNAMWRFLHAMKEDLPEESAVSSTLMNEIDKNVESMTERKVLDVIDYCYYRITDRFECGESMFMNFPDMRIPIKDFVNQVEHLTCVRDFYEAFVYFHTCAYIWQKHNLLTTFFVEYEDGTYMPIVFSFSLRTTMYRYINKVASLVSTDSICNVYLVTEMVDYGDVNVRDFQKFLQLNYEEKKEYRKKTLLTFDKLSLTGQNSHVFIDSCELIDKHSVDIVMGKIKKITHPGLYNIMLTPIVSAFREKRKKARNKT